MRMGRARRTLRLCMEMSPLSELALHVVSRKCLCHMGSHKCLCQTCQPMVSETWGHAHISAKNVSEVSLPNVLAKCHMSLPSVPASISAFLIRIPSGLSSSPWMHPSHLSHCSDLLLKNSLHDMFAMLCHSRWGSSFTMYVLKSAAFLSFLHPQRICRSPAKPLSVLALRCICHGFLSMLLPHFAIYVCSATTCLLRFDTVLPLMPRFLVVGFSPWRTLCLVHAL